MANIQIGSAVKQPTMFLCPQCRCLNGITEDLQVRFDLLREAVCGNCRAHIKFHVDSEAWETAG